MADSTTVSIQNFCDTTLLFRSSNNLKSTLKYRQYDYYQPEVYKHHLHTTNTHNMKDDLHPSPVFPVLSSSSSSSVPTSMIQDWFIELTKSSILPATSSK
ncbi:MAG: hypothetical protein Sylvanvirus9_11 [Sylvanvirus sp.]|uniref:Uncharacterized protein n=1 Tax=Sylvanvirus sp. TaxID=2487774 RepID=A0A3G5AJQ6_9VIRU|nr:MAG: hypothetical protein Sylvanvirus9_11 [Sylvanvirus sp.]